MRVIRNSYSCSPPYKKSVSISIGFVCSFPIIFTVFIFTTDLSVYRINSLTVKYDSIRQTYRQKGDLIYEGFAFLLKESRNDSYRFGRRKVPSLT